MTNIRRRAMAAPAIVAVIVLQGEAVLRGRNGIWVLAVGLAVAILWIGGWYALLLLNAKVVVTEHSVVVRNAWRKTAVYERNSIAGIAFRELVPSLWQRPRYAILYDRHHRGVAMLRREVWPSSDIERLRAALGQRTSGPTRTATVRQLSKEFPGAVPWWLRHYIVVTFAVVIAACVVGTWLFYVVDH